MAAQIPDRQYTVFYDDVRVPATALIGVEGKGWVPLFDGLNPERITAAAIGVGIGRYAVDTAADVCPHPERLGPADRQPIRRSRIRWPRRRSRSSWRR